jgi:hypothetical protein
MGKDVYYTMNSAQTSDDEIDAKVDRIVSGLFSVAVTMGKSSYALATLVLTFQALSPLFDAPRAVQQK